MKIIILGAGVIGVTTAYFLAKQGHKVTIIEKNSAASLGCSYANGGQLSYCHAEPWASKSALFPLLKAAITPNSFLSISNLGDKELRSWIGEFIKNCNQESAKNNTQKILALALRSKYLMQQLLNQEEDLKFNYKQKGTLHFFRKKKTLENATKQAGLQKTLGCNVEILDADQCIRLEPTLIKLDDQKKLAGGIYYPDDASGDSHLFTQSLAEICEEKYGVKFIFDCQVKNILTNYKKITGINTDKEVFTADHYVYALGAQGINLLKGINLNPKIYPIKGYSLSIETNQDFLSPNMALTDSENKIVYSKLGKTFRAAGTIEIGSFNNNKNPKHLAFLKNTIQKTFSDCGNIAKAKEWHDFRPFRPNSIPLVCQVEKYQNLFINSGHGSLGWTLSLSSAQIISELIENKPDELFNFLAKESVQIYSNL